MANVVDTARRGEQMERRSVLRKTERRENAGALAGTLRHGCATGVTPCAYPTNLCRRHRLLLAKHRSCARLQPSGQKDTTLHCNALIQQRDMPSSARRKADTSERSV